MKTTEFTSHPISTTLKPSEPICLEWDGDLRDQVSIELKKCATAKTGWQMTITLGSSSPRSAHPHDGDNRTDHPLSNCKQGDVLHQLDSAQARRNNGLVKGASPTQPGALPESKRLAYSVAESARLLGVHYFSVYRMIQRGKLRVCRVLRGKMLVPRSELLRLLNTE